MFLLCIYLKMFVLFQKNLNIKGKTIVYYKVKKLRNFQNLVLFNKTSF